jgi:hypothetical protein
MFHWRIGPLPAASLVQMKPNSFTFDIGSCWQIFWYIFVVQRLLLVDAPFYTAVRQSVCQNASIEVSLGNLTAMEL